MRFLTDPGLILRAEGASLFALAVVAYWQISANWLVFVVLLLAPDLGMVGYARGTRLGAATYNLVHNAIAPSAVLAYAVIARDATALSLALIWFAHIGMDRALAFGLKYPTRFKDTHLQHV